MGPEALVMYNVSEDAKYYADLTTMVQRDAVAELATISPASPGRLLSVDFPFAISKQSTPTTPAIIDYAVRNVSVALCHTPSGIPSVDEYFTGEYNIIDIV